MNQFDYIVQVVYRVTEKDCEVFGLCFEEEEISTIPLGTSEQADTGWIPNEVTEWWEDDLRDVLNASDMEYDTLYKTTVGVSCDFTKDYYGEVDGSHEVALIHHTIYGELNEESIQGVGQFFS